LANSDSCFSDRVRRGLRYLNESRLEEARWEFEGILREYPGFAPGRFWLGCVFAFQGLRAKAVEEWAMCIEIDAGFGRAHYMLSWAYYDEGDRERGYEHLSRAVESGVTYESVEGLIDRLTGKAEPAPLGIGLRDEMTEMEPIENDADEIYRRDVEALKNGGINRAIEPRSCASQFEIIKNKESFSHFKDILTSFPNKREVYLSLLFVILGFVLRFFSLIFITPVDFRWESYHYWQIAYYTLHVGTKHLRMWDLGGMEYFWGPLPIWIQSVLLWIFRAKSMIFFRFFNIIIGCATIFLAYRIGLRYGDSTSAKLAAMIAAVNPILIFNNIIGMEETLGVFFILFSLLVVNDKLVYGGVFLGLASLCRIEFWPLSFGMIGTIYLFERGRLGSRWFSVLVGWMIVVVPYMFHLQLVTGNAIYPFYWNFLGNIVGAWNPWYVSPAIRAVFGVILAASIIGYLALLKYRKRVGEWYILLITAFGFAGYHGIVYTVSGTAPLFERFFVLDAALVSCLVGLFYIRLPKRKLTNILIPIILLASFSTSVPYYVGEQDAIRDRNEFTDVLIEEYSGGTILSDVPIMTYRLIHKGGISHTNILGSIYANYQSLDTVLEWLQKENATYLITDTAESKSYRMLTFFNEPDLKDEIFILSYSWKGINLYYIDQTAIDSYLLKASH
jgi:tetratricopeptide (TPR) repeat protein